MKKIEPWIDLQEWDDMNEEYERFKCPDCECLLVVPVRTIRFYKFCPFCGKRRIENDRKD